VAQLSTLGDFTRMKEKKQSSQLTGVAGVHFVASRLSFISFHAVPTTRNVSGPDLLVSSLDGSKSLTLQVKTTRWASRTRGRGELKKPYELQWDVGRSSATLNSQNLWFAFVDLKEFDELPDVYVVPSRVVFTYFNKTHTLDWFSRHRYHPLLGDVAAYKNSWKQLKDALR